MSPCDTECRGVVDGGEGEAAGEAWARGVVHHRRPVEHRPAVHEAVADEVDAEWLSRRRVGNDVREATTGARLWGSEGGRSVDL